MKIKATERFFFCVELFSFEVAFSIRHIILDFHIGTEELAEQIQ
jgi:hypothetical protein